MDVQNREHHHASLHGLDWRGELAARLSADVESVGTVDSAAVVFGSDSQRSREKECAVPLDNVGRKLLYRFGHVLVGHRRPKSRLVAVVFPHRVRDILHRLGRQSIAVQYANRKTGGR